MSAAPEGAQISPDGHYWWDEANQQWQLNDQSSSAGPEQGQAAAAGSSSSAGTSTQSEEYTGDVQAQISLYGQCVNVDFAESEIDDVLSRAGASLEQS